MTENTQEPSTTVDKKESNAMDEKTPIEQPVAVAAETTTTTPVAAANSNKVPISPQSYVKMGGKCCGACCDYRRAVIILAFFSLLSTIYNMARGLPTQEFENDELSQDIEDIKDSYTGQYWILNILALTFTGVSILGAYFFSWVMIALSVVYSIIYYVLTVVYGYQFTNEILELLDENNYAFADDSFTEEEGDVYAALLSFVALSVAVVSGIATALWLYPSLMLIKEIREGIMTKETYPREDYSCCCTGESY